MFFVWVKKRKTNGRKSTQTLVANSIQIPNKIKSIQNQIVSNFNSNFYRMCGKFKFKSNSHHIPNQPSVNCVANSNSKSNQNNFSSNSNSNSDSFKFQFSSNSVKCMANSIQFPNQIKPILISIQNHLNPISVFYAMCGKFKFTFKSKSIPIQHSVECMANSIQIPGQINANSYPIRIQILWSV